MLSSKEEQVSVDLPDPIGLVSVKAFPGGVPISDARELRFHGVGFSTYECAAAAGGALSDALRLTSVRLRLALDVGDGRVRGSAGEVLVAARALEGVQLLPDVHGIQIFEELGQPKVLSMRARLHGAMDAGMFLAGVAESADLGRLPPRARAATSMFAFSRSESSTRARESRGSAHQVADLVEDSLGSG